jgi:hypothetical protein
VGLAAVSDEAWVVDLIPAQPPREVLEELDIAQGVLESLERLNVRFHVDLDLDRQPCVHASDAGSGSAWKLDPSALLDLLAGDDDALEPMRSTRL